LKEGGKTKDEWGAFSGEKGPSGKGGLVKNEVGEAWTWGKGVLFGFWGEGKPVEGGSESPKKEK